MADARREVNIVIKVIGDTAAKFAKIADGLKLLAAPLEQIANNVGKSNSGLSALAINLENIKSNTPNLTTFTESLKKLDSIQFSNIKSLTASINELTASLQGLNKISPDLKVLTDIGNASKVSAEKMHQMGIRSKEMGDALKRSSKDAKKSKKSTDDLSKSTSRFGEILQSIKDKALNQSIHRGLADALILVKNVATEAATAIIEYDQSLKDLQAITGASTFEVEQMGEKIKEVASTTKFSAQEVAIGMRTLGQAGLSSSEAIQSMQAVSDLATGTLSDMATTVDLTTTAMRVFRIESENTAKISDVFANAVNKSKLTIDKLRTAMNYVGPIANDAGVSFEEMTASMMVLANSGLRASTIGTGLRRVFAELVDPSTKLLKAARSAGISLDELNPSANSLSKVIKNLGLVVSDTDTAFEIFGKRGASAVLALSSADGQFESMLTTVGKSGTAAKMAATQMEGLGVSFKNLLDKLGLLAVALGDSGISAVFRVFVDLTRVLVDAITALVDTAFGKFIIGAGLLVAAIYSINVALLLLSKFAKAKIWESLGFGLASYTTKVVTAEIATSLLVMAMNPLVWVLAAVAGAAIYAITHIDSFADAANEASASAEKYGELSKKLTDYLVNSSTMVEGSDELKKSNLGLKESLTATARSMGDVSEEAVAAAASINPLTGEIKKGSTAIQVYQDKLNQLEFDKLLEATKAAGDNVENQSSATNRFVNRWGDAFGQVGTLAKGFTSSFLATLNFSSAEEHVKILDNTGKKLNRYGDKIKKSLDFSEALASGKKTFQEFHDYVNSLDLSELTKQDKDLLESYKLLTDTTDALYTSLEKVGKIKLLYTEEQIEGIVEDLGLSTMEADALLAKFNLMKKIELDSVSDSIDDWREKFSAVGGDIDSVIALGKEMGLSLTGSEEQYIRESAAAKQVVIDKKGYLEDSMRAHVENKTDTLEVYQKYEKNLTALEKEAASIRAKDSYNDKQNQLLLLKAANGVKLKEIQKVNADELLSAAQKAKELERIEVESKNKRDKILSTYQDPTQILSNSKEMENSVKATYAQLTKDLESQVLSRTITEKKASELRKKYEIEAALEIVQIWRDANKKILDQNNVNSPQTVKIRNALKEAAINAANTEVEINKKKHSENLESLKNAYTAESALASTEKEKQIAAIDIAEANGVISHRAAEEEKLQATLDYYDASYQRGKAYLESIDEGRDPSKYEAALKQLLSLEKKYYSERGKLVESYNKKVDKAEKDIDKKLDARKSSVKKHLQKLETLNIKYTDKVTKLSTQYFQKIAEAEDTHAEKVEEINYDLAKSIAEVKKDLKKDLADINDDILDNEKKLAAEILGIQDDGAVAEKKIRQKGMSDKQKDKDNRKFISKEIYKADEMVREGERTHNVAMIKQGADILKSQRSEITGLSSKNKALRYNKKVTDSLEKAARASTRVENWEKEAEAIKKVAEASDKINNEEGNAQHNKDLAQDDLDDAKDKIDQWNVTQKKAYKDAYLEKTRLENQSHDNVMSNYDKQLLKLNAQLIMMENMAKISAGRDLNTGKQVQDDATGSTTGNSSTGSVEVPVKPVIDEQASAKVEASVSTLVANAAKQLETIGKSGEQGIEQFVVATLASGKQIVGSVDYIKSNFTSLGTVIKVEAIGAVDGLGTAVSEVSQNPLEIRTEENLDEAKVKLEALSSQMSSIGQDGGFSIIEPEELAEIDTYAVKVGEMFSGLNTDDPKQKLQDMVTVLEGVGVTDQETFDSMEQSIRDYADTIPGVEVELTSAFDGYNAKLMESSGLVDENGNKLKGLSDKLQSNPLELGFDQDATQAIVSSISDIDGAVDHLHDKAEEEAAVQLNTEAAEKSVADLQKQLADNKEKVQNDKITMEALDSSNFEQSLTEPEQAYQDMMEGIMEPIELPAPEPAADSKEKVKEPVEEAKAEIEAEPIEPVIKPAADSKEKVKEPVEKAKAEIEAEPIEPVIKLNTTEWDSGIGAIKDSLSDLETEKVTTQVEVVASDGSPLLDYIKTLITEITGIGETEATVTVAVEREEFDKLVTELEELVNKELQAEVVIQVSNVDELKSLITWLDQVVSSNPTTVEVKAEVTGNDKVVLLKQNIDKLIGKFVSVVATVKGIIRARELKEAIDALKSKEIIITTEYRTTGTPPSEHKASGGEVQGFANGGGVFRKLASPFISKGSGTKDDVPAMLMKGEFVQKVSAVDKYGKDFMHRVNQGLYPVELARKGIAKFAGGGSVYNSNSSSSSTSSNNYNRNSIVQNFAAGGAVLSGIGSNIRKKVLELLGIDVNMNIADVHIDNSTKQNMGNIQTELGRASVASMKSAFTESVESFAMGGSIDKNTFNIVSSTGSEILSSYDKAILSAQNANNEKLAEILKEERDAISSITNDLQTTLNGLADDYSSSTSEIGSTYTEGVDDENASYTESVFDDDIDYSRTKEDYDTDAARELEDFDKDKATALSDYNADVEEENTSYAKDVEEENTSYEEDVDEENASYKEDVDEENASYAEDSADALASYEEDLAEYEQDKLDAIAEKEEKDEEERLKYEKDKAKLAEDTIKEEQDLLKELLESKSKLDEASEALNELGKEYGFSIHYSSPQRGKYPMPVETQAYMQEGIEYPDVDNILNLIRSRGAKDFAEYSEGLAWAEGKSADVEVLHADVHEALSDMESLGLGDSELWARSGALVDSKLESVAKTVASAKHKEDLEAITKTYDADYNTRGDEHNTTIGEYNISIADLTSSYNSETATRDSEHSTNLTTLDSDHNSTISELDSDHNSTISELDSDHNSAITELDSNHITVSTELDSAYSTKLADLIASYTESRADADLSWERYQEDAAISNSRRDADHAEALLDLENKKSSSLEDASSSYNSGVSSSKESADNDINSAKEKSVSSIDANDKELANTLKSINDESAEASTKDEITDISVPATSEGTENATLSHFSIEEFLKKLRYPNIHFNTGGEVPHTSTSVPGKDSIVAALTPGEFVIREGAVKTFGAGFFESLNNLRIPKFNLGGAVGAAVSSSSAIQSVQHTLALTINENQHEALTGSAAGIDAILNDLAFAKMRA